MSISHARSSPAVCILLRYVHDPVRPWRRKIYSSENNSPSTKNVKSYRDASTTYRDLYWCYSHGGFAWKDALVNVTPKTFIRWHRAGFRLFWRWKCRPGRPRIPPELRALIREMARDNSSWGEERIANELLLKPGIRISPRTARKYMPKHPRGQPRGDQRWSTFVYNHAKAIVACDFCIAVTATFRVLYVFVVMEHGSRKILHCNMTAHPTAQWTLQQLREAILRSDSLFLKAKKSRHRSLVDSDDELMPK